ncbi:hypothetical protein CO180_02165 [candidate division WWE3 bacterium CG_4_9_14_3_um_filter_41_6]|uniref:Triosephosphate isomerase n=1 Tax=candidate division WWE3 bacterium CG_4_10_14_0_2_um_filter_41_14 TaxID=1975072 RepID=A0A2M7TK19_UNCKA|nr:MAG: hypothetical protein COY32_02415 [candidate division WWE3 bacterium CG_4_10_14_0_2_um_filter_41_14]PJA38874.1 MAG: hypothetical protein CO180_02165 [candidate division WWE3 bacterium CG_4_9_14_3_um_filter_41_6]
MLVIANWKLNHTLLSVSSWLDEVFATLLDLSVTKVALAPSFTELAYVYQELLTEGLDQEVFVYAQNVSGFEDGQYTGEVSAKQLAEQFVSGAIIGHSERRRLFGETDADVAEKITRCLKHDIVPIVAISSIQQIENIADLVDITRITVAYEPLGAIGSGNPANPKTVSAFLGELDEKYQPESMIYGGSVSAHDVESFLEIDNISGFLVGTASVEPSHFVDLLKAIERY